MAWMGQEQIARDRSRSGCGRGRSHPRSSEGWIVEYVHGLPVQARSGHEKDLQLGHHQRGRTDGGSDAALESALKASRGMAMALVDQGRADAGGTTATVPELSSLLLFAASLLVARTGMKRRGVAAR